VFVGVSGPRPGSRLDGYFRRLRRIQLSQQQGRVIGGRNFKFDQEAAAGEGQQPRRPAAQMRTPGR
jgi:hypothetical protein